MTTLILQDRSGPITQEDAPQIHHLIEASRTVLRANHNRSWDAKISLITDNVKLAHVRLPNPKWHINPDDRSKKIWYGFCWNTYEGHVLWFDNRWQRIRSEAVRTLCHEVAHALVNSSVHGQTWRRAYALMLPLWLQVMDPPRPKQLTIREQVYEEMVRVALKYRRKTNRSLFAISDEVSDHMAAINRKWRQENGLFIPTTV